MPALSESKGCGNFFPNGQENYCLPTGFLLNHNKCYFNVGVSPTAYSKHKSLLVMSVIVDTCISMHSVSPWGYDLVNPIEATSKIK